MIGQEDEEGGKIESIPKKKDEDLIEIIRSGMQSSKKSPSSERQESSCHTQPETVHTKGETATQIQPDSQSVTSIADELAKLAKLRDQGVITEAEFVQMKGNLIKRT